jgi:hypothetical protein
MPNDKEIIQDSYYIRNLVNYSDKTKELAQVFFDLLSVERAITMNELGEGVKIKNIRDVRGRIVDQETVPFSQQDYDRRSGIVEGLGWLEPEIETYINRADREDGRKNAEKEE